MSPVRIGRMWALSAAMMFTAAACSSDSSSDSIVTPPPPPPPPEVAAVANVSVTPSVATLPIGQTQQLTVTTLDAQGRTLTGRVIAYASAAPAIASVTPAGIVTAVAPGQAEITVTSEGKSAQAQVTVPTPAPAAVALVELTPATFGLDAGTSRVMTAVLRDAQQQVLTDRAVAWSSSAPNVATVDAQGRVVGVSSGTSRITATSEGKSAEAIVTVRSLVASLEIVGALDTLEAYDVRQLQAIARDASGNVVTSAPITWTSSNPAFATVAFTQPNSSATITGVDRGTVVITATTGAASASVTRVVVIKYRSITTGTMHACNLASGGIAWCWGLNGTDARLGLDLVGDNVFRSEPFQVPGGHRFTQLVTYARFTCGLRTDGKAYCWGNNGWGSLGNGSNIAYSSTPVAVAGNHTFTKLAAGTDHACGLSTLGTMLCWGHNDWGQFGRGNTTSSTIPLVAANGMVFTAIAAGPQFSCGVAFDGNSYCMGHSGLGQLGDGQRMSYGNTFSNTPSKVVGNTAFASITLGNQYACALTANGQAYCWGSNNGKLGDGSTGTDGSTPRPVLGGLTFTMLSSGYGHTCGVTTTADVYCWGGNNYGQLGNAVPSSRVPVIAGSGLKASEVAAAGIGTGFAGHTCAITRDRLTTVCWGRNDAGQLGNGTTYDASAVNPTPSIVKTQKPL